MLDFLQKYKWLIVMVFGAIGALAPFLLQDTEPKVTARVSYSDYLRSPVLEEDYDDTLEEKLHDLKYRYTGFMLVTATNTGEKRANDVVLRLPFSGIYGFEKERHTGIGLPFKNQIELGAIRLGEVLQLNIWVEFASPSTIPKDMTISHEDGFGEIKFEKKMYSLWELISLFEILSYALPFLAIAMVIVPIAHDMTKKAKVKAEENEP